MSDRESPILHAVRAVLAADPRVTIWRCNGGVDVVRGVRYGLGKGAADLIGIVMMPSLVGRFFAIETKAPKRGPSPDQRLWAQAVRAKGGFYAIARSADEALRALDRCCAGEVQ